MTIKWKITALVAILFAVLGVAEMFVAKNVLMPSFNELESKEADIAMRRVQYGMDQTLDQLALTVGSWGNWTDAYRFAQDHNRTFVAEQVTASGMTQLNINALLFVDLAGHILASDAIDLRSGKEFDLDLTSAHGLTEDFPWRANLADGRPAKGLLKTNRGILMVAAAPVLDGYGHGPSRGMVIIGRLLSAAEIEKIGAHAQANVSMVPLRDSSNPAWSFKTDEVTQVYRTLNDLYGRPIMTLRVDVPREITRRGHSAVNYASGYLMAAAVIVVTLLVVILNRVVLSPLALVTSHAVSIGEGRDLTTRLNFKDRDEIGVLAREFDRMVERVAESRSQLIDQSFHAGKAEVATNVLHNVGNILNSVNISASLVAERVRHSKASGVSRIASLLLGQGPLAGQFITNDERGRRVPEYLAALGEQLLTDQRVALEEIVSLQENLEHIKNTVAMQQKFARLSGVTEVVPVADLVEDSVRLNAGAFEHHGVTLRRDFSDVPPITVDRHKVLQILVNLIRNAKYACDDSGHADKVITLRIESSAPGVRISVIDNGIGIPSENMGRIFNHGFTTRESGHGFGLHSAALAAQELGGCLRAESDGPGRGAMFVLDLPLAPPAAAARAA
jgi:two-component system, NtrC family, sensor kinase